MTNPTERDALRHIGEGYTGPHRRDRTARVAAGYRHDPQIEEWISWRTTDPARYQKLSASTLTAIGYYEGAKRAAYDALPTERERLDFRRRGGTPEPDDAA